MHPEGLRYLGKLAKTVPPGGTIVEVGPLFGSSTWVLSKNAHPSVTIYSIDTWEPAEWIERRFPDGPAFSLDTFKRMVQDCPNVIPIQGWSPQVVSDWDRPIDLFFDDATHGDPGFSENVEFFKPFLKDDSILCGDDFASGWPDIVRVIGELGERWGRAPEVAGRVWSLVNEGRASVSSRLPAWSACDLKTAVTTRRGETMVSEPYMWSGNLHRRVPLRMIRAWPTSKATMPVDFGYQIKDRDGAVSDLVASPDKLVADHYIRDASFQLAPGAERDWSIHYRLCWFKANPRRCAMTPWLRDGEWGELPEDSRIVAFQVCIEPR